MKKSEYFFRRVAPYVFIMRLMRRVVLEYWNPIKNRQRCVVWRLNLILANVDVSKISILHMYYHV